MKETRLQRLGEDVGELSLTTNMKRLYQATDNAISNLMTIELNVFGSLMKDMIIGYVDGSC